MRRYCRAFQHFHVKTLFGGGDIAGEFTHLVHLSVVGVLECHGQHFVGIQGAAGGDVSQSAVEGVLRRRQQTGAFHFLIVAATLDAECLQRLERLGYGVDIAGVGVFALYNGEQVIGCVGGVGEGGVGLPVVVGEPRVFAEVGESHQVAALLVASALVGHPHFDTCNAHTRRHIWQARGEGVVVLVEKLGEEIVPVLVVLVGVDGELGGLGAAVGVHAAAFGILLRYKRRGCETPELQLGLDTEQRCGAADQRGAGGHAHVTGFDGLHDIVFLAFVGQL